MEYSRREKTVGPATDWLTPPANQAWAGTGLLEGHGHLPNKQERRALGERRAPWEFEVQLSGLHTVLCLGLMPTTSIGCGGTMLRPLADNPKLEVHYVVQRFECAWKLRTARGTYCRRRAASGEVADFRRTTSRTTAAVKAYVDGLGRELAPIRL